MAFGTQLIQAITIENFCCRIYLEKEFFDRGVSDRDLISGHFKKGAASCSSDLVPNQMDVHSVVRIIIATFDTLGVGVAVFVHDLGDSWLDLGENAPGQTNFEKLQIIGIGLAQDLLVGIVETIR